MTDPALRPIRSRALALLLSVLVLGIAAPAGAAEPAAVGGVVGPTVAVPPTAASAVATGTASSATATSAPASPPRRPRAARTASVAGDPAVTIRDFSFGPSAVTIKVGDTITWTNHGPTDHTATGAGFDTGILRAGQSSSHTFASAGTFSYHCTLHPFMKGTIAVVAAAAPPAAAPAPSPPPHVAAASPASPGASAAPAQAQAQAQALPNTGLDAWQVAALGALSLLCGLALRRATRPPRTARTSRAPRGF